MPRTVPASRRPAGACPSPLRRFRMASRPASGIDLPAQPHEPTAQPPTIYQPRPCIRHEPPSRSHSTMSRTVAASRSTSRQHQQPTIYQPMSRRPSRSHSTRQPMSRRPASVPCLSRLSRLVSPILTLYHSPVVRPNPASVRPIPTYSPKRKNNAPTVYRPILRFIISNILSNTLHENTTNSHMSRATPLFHGVA